MTVSRQQIESLIMECISDALEEMGEDRPATSGSRIYGGGSSLDSMAVVSTIIEVESRLSEELGLIVSLSDDRAMSQERSPFRDVGSLTDYIVALSEEI